MYSLSFRLVYLQSNVFVYFRWKSSRVCRFGRFCTYAHGNGELKSWMGHKSEIQETRREGEKTETDADAEKTGNKQKQPEPNADITRSEVLHSQPQQCSGVRC